MTRQDYALPFGESVERFLQYCLRGRWDTGGLQAAHALVAQKSFGWSALREKVDTESLAPLMYHLVRDQNLVPPAIEQAWHQAYYDTAGRNILLRRYLRDVLRAASASGIDVILLKGAALIETVYGNAALRPMIDLDLLVRRADVPNALRVLESLGYLPARTETRSGAAVAYESQTTLHKAGAADTLIEAHWSLFDSPYYQHRLAMDWFWQTALPVRIEGTHAWVLAPEAQVLHLGAHMRLHHGGDEWLWLHDIAEVIVSYQSQMDWNELLARAQAFELVLPLQRVLPRLVDGWGVPVPDDAMERLCALRASSAEMRVFNRLTAENRSVAQRFWADLASLPSWRHRVRFAWANLFPSPAYMRSRYHIIHPFLVLFSYPYRWFLGLRKSILPSAGSKSLRSRPKTETVRPPLTSELASDIIGRGFRKGNL